MGGERVVGCRTSHVFQVAAGCFTCDCVMQIYPASAALYNICMYSQNIYMLHICIFM